MPVSFTIGMLIPDALSYGLDTFMFVSLTAGSLEGFPPCESTLYKTGLLMESNTLQNAKKQILPLTTWLFLPTSMLSLVMFPPLL